MTNPDHHLSQAEIDYRASHLQRGASYDENLLARPFDAYMAAQEAAFLQQTVPQLFGALAPRCLDFACGTGRITQVVAPMASEMLGVDISEGMLHEARRKCPGVRFVHADITRSAGDLGTFDLITSFRFFGNAQDELRSAAMQALARMLRPGGYLIVNNHRNPMSIALVLNRLTGGARDLDFTHAKLRRLMSAAGLEIHQRRPVGAWMWRSKLLRQTHDPAYAQRQERRFSAPWLCTFAPDSVVVARKI